MLYSVEGGLIATFFFYPSLATEHLIVTMAFVDLAFLMQKNIEKL